MPAQPATRPEPCHARKASMSRQHPPVCPSPRPLAGALVLCTGALFGALCAAPAAQAGVVANPPIRMTQAGVEYMSGGIGQDEARLMRTVAPRWPASFEFAVQDGRKADFTADVRVTVRNADSGAVVLDHVDARGPFLVARLPAGRYTADATLGGRTLQRELTVNGTGAAKALFVFPAGTDMASNAAVPAAAR